MKPGSRDYQHNFVVSGHGLHELQQHTYMMAESVEWMKGLDR
jgi:hypothetical protein